MSSPNPKTPTTTPPPPTTTISGHRFRPNPHPLPLPNPTLPITTATNLRSSRRSNSSSSSSSSSSSFSSSPHLSPTTPLRDYSSIAAVPFSWEQFPGIPKSSISKRDVSNHLKLPLPPIVKKQSNWDFTKGDRFLRDPFVEALIQCSKDGDEVGLIGSRRQRSRGRFAGYNCKRSCGVVESIAFVPRVKRITNAGYDLIEKRRG